MSVRSDGRTRICDFIKEIPQFDLLEFERLRAGEREQLLREIGASLSRIADTVDHPLQLVLVVRIAQRQVCSSEDRGQEIVKVMRDATSELAECLHFLRSEQLLARFLKPEPVFALLGHVAGDFCEADELAVVVSNGINDGACPKPRAILSHAPSFRFISAHFACCFERRSG